MSPYGSNKNKDRKHQRERKTLQNQTFGKVFGIKKWDTDAWRDYAKSKARGSAHQAYELFQNPSAQDSVANAMNETLGNRADPRLPQWRQDEINAKRQPYYPSGDNTSALQNLINNMAWNASTYGEYLKNKKQAFSAYDVAEMLYGR